MNDVRYFVLLGLVALTLLAVLLGWHLT